MLLKRISKAQGVSKGLLILTGIAAAMLAVAAPAFAQSSTTQAGTVEEPRPPSYVSLTGVVHPVPPSIEGPSHTITEEPTGDVYDLFSASKAVDLSQYEGQRVTINGIFQTPGNPLSSFDDPTDILIYVTSVGVPGEAPVPGDQYEGNATVTDDQYVTRDQYGDASGLPGSEPANNGAGDNGSGGTIDVLPDTGGATLLTLGAGALLIAGGLLARRITR